MKLKLRFAVPCVAFLLIGAGCKKEDEATTPPVSSPSTQSSTTGTPAPEKPAVDPMAAMDFSSPEKIDATVVPVVKDMLAKNPALVGTALDVMLKDKVLHIKGDVKNNLQKRAIDDTVKPLMDKAKAAGINILNGAIVKG